MLEEYSEHLKSALRRSATFGGTRISPAHLLIAILREDGCQAIALLRAIDVNTASLVTRLERQLPRSEPTQREVPVSAVTTSVLSLAGDFRRWLGHKRTGTEHVLLAFLSKNGDPPQEFLTAEGLDLGRAYQSVLAKLETPSPITSAAASQRPYWQILKEMGFLNEGQLQEALSIRRRESGFLGDILVKLGYVGREELLLALAAQMNMEVVDLDALDISPEVIKRLPANMAKNYQVIPIQWENNVLTIAMANPQDVNIRDDLRVNLNCEIQGAVASEEAVMAALERYYGEGKATPGITPLFPADDEPHFEKVRDPKIVIKLVEWSLAVDSITHSEPVLKLLKLILGTALRANASDVHFELFEDQFMVRYRVDGILYEMESPPVHLGIPMLSQLKLLVGLNPIQKDEPQETRTKLYQDGRLYAIDVSSLPTVGGESMVIAIAASPKA